MLKSFADLKSVLPREPRILADLTQGQVKAQHPGARRVYTKPSPFDPHALYMSEGSVNMARTMPSDDEFRRPVENFVDRAPAEAPQRIRRVAGGRGRRNEKRFYAPQDGHGEGESVVFVDKSNGQVLARCHGSRQHVVGEAIKLALSQGGRVTDLDIIPAQD